MAGNNGHLMRTGCTGNGEGRDRDKTREKDGTTEREREEDENGGEVGGGRMKKERKEEKFSRTLWPTVSSRQIIHSGESRSTMSTPATIQIHPRDRARISAISAPVVRPEMRGAKGTRENNGGNDDSCLPVLYFWPTSHCARVLFLAQAEAGTA